MSIVGLILAWFRVDQFSKTLSTEYFKGVPLWDLWPLKVMASRPVGVWQATDIHVLDIHELAAGKLAALLSRKQARDLFDCSHLFRTGALDPERLRLAFVLYGAMNRRDWRTVVIEEVNLDIKDFEQKLLPMLRSKGVDTMGAASFLGGLIKDCHHGLAALLPFTETEMEFLDRLLTRGEISPELLTADEDLQDRIRRHPADPKGSDRAIILNTCHKFAIISCFSVLACSFYQKN